MQGREWGRQYRKARPDRVHFITRDWKQCSTCRIWKRSSEFRKKKASTDGRGYKCKDCVREYNRQWRKNNPEKAREHYVAHAEKERAIGRRYYAANREQVKRTNQQYREANREQVRACSARWNKTHPEQIRASNRARRACKASAPGNGVTTQLWIAILDFYEHTCLACGAVEGLTMDHVIPLIDGGAHDVSNIQPLCGHCNSVKGTKHTDYRSREQL